MSRMGGREAPPPWSRCACWVLGAGRPPHPDAEKDRFDAPAATLHCCLPIHQHGPTACLYCPALSRTALLCSLLLWSLLQVGDLLDRGDHEIPLLYWLERLRRQAAAAGGALHVLNGNHETMNVAGQYRYVTRGGMHRWGLCGAYCVCVVWGAYAVCCWLPHVDAGQALLRDTALPCPAHPPAVAQLQGLAARPHNGGSPESKVRLRGQRRGAAPAAAPAPAAGRTGAGAGGCAAAARGLATGQLNHSSTHGGAAAGGRADPPLPGAQPSGAASGQHAVCARRGADPACGLWAGQDQPGGAGGRWGRDRDRGRGWDWGGSEAWGRHHAAYPARISCLAG
jgi:hypothetical protein